MFVIMTDFTVDLLDLSTHPQSSFFSPLATYQCVTGGRGDGAILALQQREAGVVRMGGDWAVLLSHPQPSRALVHHRPVKGTRQLAHQHLNTHTLTHITVKLSEIARSLFYVHFFFFHSGCCRIILGEKDLLCVFLFCFPQGKNVCNM